ncbi:hypothetical protein pipiens_011360 [Culex pipiens pipiens]|uniref:Uncharacterized protein n=1 Tax=Culex pipiens pipiens TaxID=38569 RepID=A0ABD1D6M2_CULPP
MYNLKPVTAFRRFPTSNKGRHLFDLFYDPEDLGNCIELDSKAVALLYGAENIRESRCINPVLEFDEITQICNYHAFEQLRFTTIANDTVLVEDLSPHVPPGTRMIFRSAVEPSGHETGQKPKCQCRVLRRDWAHYKRCIRHHRQQIESAVQIQRAREKVVKEFRIGLTILVASCFCTMVNNYLSVHVDITCQRKSGVLFIYDTKNVLGSRCINHVSLEDGLAQACNYHAHEQVRFTAIGNDTVLVEDLAPFLPPGTRMIFRKVANASVRHQSPKCQCRILRRDSAKGVRCVQYHQRLLDEAEQLREIRRRIAQEFWTALGILVVSCSCTVVVKCWATRKINEVE